jgi:hypothetical protein
MHLLRYGLFGQGEVPLSPAGSSAKPEGCHPAPGRARRRMTDAASELNRQAQVLECSQHRSVGVVAFGLG